MTGGDRHCYPALPRQTIRAPPNKEYILTSPSPPLPTPLLPSPPSPTPQNTMVESTGSTSSTGSLGAPKSLRDIFPPVRKSHILNCAFASWHALYRAYTPKARTIPLTNEFLSYLREDGIILPDDEEQITTLSDSDASEGETESEDEDEDGVTQDRRNPTQRFPELHQRIKTTIRELGGKVSPKLNWSSPKDAAFMTATNTLECRTPGEIYLLLKSSDFITHDLEHAFRDCVDDDDDDNDNDDGDDEKEGRQQHPSLTADAIPYHLTLRKWFALNPSLEFRVFVSGRRILAMTQRDLNHYDFLPSLRAVIVSAITRFFTATLAATFPDPDFVFDVYIPLSSTTAREDPNDDDDDDDSGRPRVWLIDINPWAARTDSILFSWMELLRLRNGETVAGEEVELRLVGRDDPEAYQFMTPQYGASKLPRDVVDVGLEGEEAVWEFARRWRNIVEKAERERGERTAG